MLDVRRHAFYAGARKLMILVAFADPMYLRYKPASRRYAACLALTLVSLVSLGDSPAAALQVDLRALGAAAYAQCHYYRNDQHFNTCSHGRVADEAAVELQRDLTVRVILIDASAASGERAGIEARRAEQAWGYLVYEKGIHPDRIVMRWNRVSRQCVGKWGGSMRILVVRTGDRLPEFIEDDLSWQLETP